MSRIDLGFCRRCGEEFETNRCYCLYTAGDASKADLVKKYKKKYSRIAHQTVFLDVDSGLQGEIL